MGGGRWSPSLARPAQRRPGRRTWRRYTGAQKSSPSLGDIVVRHVHQGGWRAPGPAGCRTGAAAPGSPGGPGRPESRRSARLPLSRSCSRLARLPSAAGIWPLKALSWRSRPETRPSEFNVHAVPLAYGRIPPRPVGAVAPVRPRRWRGGGPPARPSPCSRRKSCRRPCPKPTWSCRRTRCLSVTELPAASRASNSLSREPGSWWPCRRHRP